MIPVWPKYVLRNVEARIGSINSQLFSKHQPYVIPSSVHLEPYKYPTNRKSFPFRYLPCIPKNQNDREYYPELVFYGKPPHSDVMLISCAFQPHMYIQSPFYPCINELINAHIRELEEKFPDMCFDVTCLKTPSNRNKK